MQRVKAKMGAENRIRAVVMFVEWRTMQRPDAPPPPPRTQWRNVQPCAACNGLGFVPKDPA